MGRADFLLRVDDAERAAGRWSYEAADAKLARRVRSEAILQLCEYSAHLERLQGTAPASMQVILGDGTEHRVSRRRVLRVPRNREARFRVGDARRARTTPIRIPVEHCNTCGFAARCAAQRKQDDHLSQVARMRSGQVLALTVGGDRHHDRARAVVSRCRAARAHERRRRFRELRAQAALAAPRARTPDGVAATRAARCLGGRSRPVRAAESVARRPLLRHGGRRSRARRAARVPLRRGRHARRRTARGGATTRPGSGAHSRSSSTSRSRSSIAIPDMHIYHYAAYEKTALRRLMSRHGTREEEVDRLLRNEVLVDLYRVVRQGIRLSTDSYSLKKVERLYMPAREESIADAAGSMVMYERWLISREDGGDGDATLLDEIAMYNERDCISTAQLRDWLEARRVEEEALRGAPIERPPVIERDRRRRAPGEDRRDPGGRGRAGRRCAGGPRACRPTRERARVVARAAAVVSPAREQGELVASFRPDRDESRGARARHVRARTARDDRLPRGRHAAIIERYRFEPQEHRIGLGDKPLDPRGGPCAGRRSPVRSPSSTPARGEITLSRTPGQADRGPVRFLIPSTPLQTDAQEESLLDLGRWVVANGADAAGPQSRRARSADAPAATSERRHRSASLASPARRRQRRRSA